MRFLLAFAVSASVFAQAQDSKPQDKARIEGVLLNQATGQPLRKGTLTLQPVGASQRPAAARLPGAAPPEPSGYVATSSPEGKFVFEQVDPGRYTLRADRPGFIGAAYRPSSGTLTVGPGQVLNDIRISIVPQGVIAGRVLDEDGDPTTDVRVQAMRWGYINGAKRMMGFSNTTADDQGNFRLSGLVAGKYILYADSNRMIPFNPSKDAYVTTYFPNALDLNEATPINLTPGAEVTGTEIRLRKMRVFRVRGKAVDGNGAPVRNMALALLPKNANPQAMSLNRNITISRDGSFDFRNVMAGSYFIEPATNVMFGPMDANDAPPKKLFGRFAVTITTEDLSDLVVMLGPGAIVTGAIATEGGDSPAPKDQQPTGAKPPALPTVRLNPDNFSSSPYSAHASADGTFEIQNLAPDRYRVEVSGAPDGVYVKSVRFGNEDVTYGVLDLSAGGGALDIKLSAQAADVSGIVRSASGEPVTGAQVTLAPSSAELAASMQFIRVAGTNSEGKYSIKNLPPGEYRLLAWQDADMSLVNDPEFRAHFDSKSAVVKLFENSHETSDLTQIPHDAVDTEAARAR